MREITASGLFEEHLYVDDCLISVADEPSAIQMLNQLCDLLERGGFDITKWVSNSRMTLASVPPPKRDKNVKILELNVGISLPVERALGVHWKLRTNHQLFKC